MDISWVIFAIATAGYSTAPKCRKWRTILATTLLPGINRTTAANGLSQILKCQTIQWLIEPFGKTFFDQPAFVVIKIFIVDHFIVQLVKFRSAVMLTHEEVPQKPFL